MYNEYDDLSFEEKLHLTEEEMRRKHNQQIFLRRNAQLLQQELELEAELLIENPELAQVINSLNMQEIQAHQQGLRGVVEGELTPKSQSIWAKFFPGFGGK